MRRLVLLLCFILASLSARADFVYSFTDFGGQTFSFTAPSLITTARSIAITPLTIQGATFTQASVSMSGSNVCFYFATAGITGGCSGTHSGSGAYFSGIFVSDTTVGTHSYTSTSAGTINTSGVSTGNLLLKTLTISGTLAAIPEPSSLILLGGGFLAVVGVMRRKLLA